MVISPQTIIDYCGIHCHMMGPWEESGMILFNLFYNRISKGLDL
jgi:hypothetical protein